MACATDSNGRSDVRSAERTARPGPEAGLSDGEDLTEGEPLSAHQRNTFVIRRTLFVFVCYNVNMNKEVWHEKRWLRIAVILIIAVDVYLFAPSWVDFGTALSPNMLVVLVVFITSFLIAQALQRWQGILAAVRTELSRIRRILHLSHTMSGQVAWKRNVHKAAVAYLTKVLKLPIAQYEQAHKSFRVFSHLIYHFKPKTARDKIVFDEMLDVARDIAFQRTLIENFLRSRPLQSAWITLVLMSAATIFLFAVSHGGGVLDRLYAAGVVMGVLLLLDLLYETNRITVKNGNKIHGYYRESLADIKKLH